MLGHHVVHLVAARDGELESSAQPVQRGIPGAEQAHHAQRFAGRAWFVVVLRCLQGDVVAEPLRLLVGVGVAPDVHEQGAVVHGRSRLVVESQPLGEPECDEALPQDVLHGLPEAQVDPERERRDDLGEPNRRSVRRGGHGPTDATRLALQVAVLTSLFNR